MLFTGPLQIASFPPANCWKVASWFYYTSVAWSALNCQYCVLHQFPQVTEVCKITWTDWCNTLLSTYYLCSGAAGVGGCHLLTTKPVETNPVLQNKVSEKKICVTVILHCLYFHFLLVGTSQEGSSTNSTNKTHSWFRFQQKLNAFLIFT